MATGTMATGTGTGNSRGRMRASACKICKDGKRRCHGGRPCNRCLRLNLNCTNSDNTKGQQQGCATLPPAFVAPKAPKPLSAIDYAVCATDPNALLRTVEETMMGLAQRGLLHRESVTHQLRGWYALCGGLHSDVTRGLFTCMITALGIPEAEACIKIKQEANLGVVAGESEADRTVRARKLHLRRLKIKSERLADLKTFTEEDDGFTAVYMILYWGEHGLFLAVNDVFEETFASAERMLEMVIERSLVPEFLPLAWVHQEDRADFLELLFAVLFDPRTPFHPNRLVRMLDCEGNVTLRSVGVNAISTPDGKRGAVVKLHMAPPTKLLDARFQALVPVPALFPSGVVGANGGGAIDSKLPAPPAACTASASGAASHGFHGAWGIQVQPTMPFPPHTAAGGSRKAAASAAAAWGYEPGGPGGSQYVFMPIHPDGSDAASSCGSEHGYDPHSLCFAPSSSSSPTPMAAQPQPVAPAAGPAWAPTEDIPPIITDENVVPGLAPEKESVMTPTVNCLCLDGVDPFEECELEMMFED